MNQSKSLASAAVSLACVAVVSSASAGEPEVRTEAIQYQDLNLASAAGVNELYSRIHAAAVRVCAVAGEGRMDAASGSGKCMKQAVARAVDRLDMPALTQLAASR